MSLLFIAEILALVTAVLFATGDFVGRLAIRHAPPYMGGLMSAAVGCVVFGAAWLAIPSTVPLNLPGVVWFFFAGLIHPAFGFIILLKAFEKAGVGRSAAILGTGPFFSVAIAILFLGERPTWFVLGGTLLIVLGVVCVSLEEGTEGPVKWKSLGYPFLTAFLFGLAPVLRKSGLNHIPSPMVGMAISSLSGTVCLLACAGFFPAGRRFNGNRRGIGLYTISGALFALGVYTYFSALEKGDVSIVVPLLFTHTLMLLVLVHFFLRQFERLAPRLAGGAVLIVCGAVVITTLG
jgi:uncharacterized membrane protein